MIILYSEQDDSLGIRCLCQQARYQQKRPGASNRTERPKSATWHALVEAKCGGEGGGRVQGTIYPNIYWYGQSST